MRPLAYSYSPFFFKIKDRKLRNRPAARFVICIFFKGVQLVLKKDSASPTSLPPSSLAPSSPAHQFQVSSVFLIRGVGGGACQALQVHSQREQTNCGESERMSANKCETNHLLLLSVFLFLFYLSLKKKRRYLVTNDESSSPPGWGWGE